jgi:hypothetical protein
MSADSGFYILTVSTIFASAAIGGALPFYVSSRWPTVMGLLNAAAGVPLM